MMRRTRIKVCGLTRADDARAAVACGVDAVGMIFYPPSPRAVDIAQAEKVVAVVPAFVTKVGVFVDATEEEVSQVLERVALDVIQFHGDEPPERCARAPRPYIKTVAMKDTADIERMHHSYPDARALLLDTYSESKKGGTGRTFDWRLVPTSRDSDGPSIVLAGGLNSDNVADAIKAVAPFAVDVNGGVESSPGIKDIHKIERFVSEVQRVKAA